ncbi:hypothetical protein AB0F43_33200 [Kribbella sp. NPDC023972]|uniref:hypothetical protein n=1 Tax=Kribbella sp. NPDC023972 TaxID=3154795 RepID=UPI0033E9598A
MAQLSRAVADLRNWFMEHLNEGIEISPATLMALARRRIMLSLDIYGHGDEASEA